MNRSYSCTSMHSLEELGMPIWIPCRPMETNMLTVREIIWTDQKGSRIWTELYIHRRDSKWWLPLHSGKRVLRYNHRHGVLKKTAGWVFFLRWFIQKPGGITVFNNFLFRFYHQENGIITGFSFFSLENSNLILPAYIDSRVHPHSMKNDAYPSPTSR